MYISPEFKEELIQLITKNKEDLELENTDISYFVDSILNSLSDYSSCNNKDIDINLLDLIQEEF